MGTHGIFCLEGDWFGVQDRTTVEPVLQLLQHSLRVPYIHRDIGTREEFDYYLDKWTQKRLARYPVLYLGFHGEEGALYVGHRRGAAGLLTLDELGDMLAGRCKKQVIHFGACETMKMHGAALNRFLKKTEALAITGFKEDVGWVESAAFEVLLLGSLQEVTLTKQGVGKLQRLVRDRAGKLADRLGFRIKLSP